MMWFWFALGSAVFAALTSILAKVGIEGVNSNLATAAGRNTLHQPEELDLSYSVRSRNRSVVALL